MTDSAMHRTLMEALQHPSNASRFPVVRPAALLLLLGKLGQ